ncbi:MAG TPA: carbohydrate ABC transporter permease, partial [Clostridiales bacterium]|nr:carbohydrate ABC transporter permease [Clostridiales bacterium]
MKYSGNPNKLNRIKGSTNALFNAIFIILSLMCILPVIFVFIISISSEASLAKYGYQFIPRGLEFKAYEFLWGERKTILNSLGISILVTTVGTVLGVALTT